MDQLKKIRVIIMTFDDNKNNEDEKVLFTVDFTTQAEDLFFLLPDNIRVKTDEVIIDTLPLDFPRNFLLEKTKL